MDILGVPIYIWHSLIVEEPTGISVFIILVLAARVLTDMVTRGKSPSSRVEWVRQTSDNISYVGSITAVLFLIISAGSGYLIQSYSSLVAQPILINIALMALCAIFFWSVFFILRLLAGAGLWSHRDLYLLAIITAALALLFDALAASIGAELTVGQSALDPVYKALNFSWRTFTIQPLEIGVTLSLALVGIGLVLVLPRLESLKKVTN